MEGRQVQKQIVKMQCLKGSGRVAARSAGEGGTDSPRGKGDAIQDEPGKVSQ